MEYSLAGIIGVPLGSFISFKLRNKYPWVDPGICGMALLCAAPFVLGALFAAESNVVRENYCILKFNLPKNP